MWFVHEISQSKWESLHIYIGPTRVFLPGPVWGGICVRFVLGIWCLGSAPNSFLFWRVFPLSVLSFRCVRCTKSGDICVDFRRPASSASIAFSLILHWWVTHDLGEQPMILASTSSLGTCFPWHGRIHYRVYLLLLVTCLLVEYLHTTLPFIISFLLVWLISRTYS